MPTQATVAQIVRPAVRTATAPAHAPRIANLSLADQWAKLSRVLASSIANATAAQDLQHAATRQLDLAQYGLTTLVDELSAVMTVPGHSRRKAIVHKLASHEVATGDAAPSQGKVGAGHALAA